MTYNNHTEAGHIWRYSGDIIYCFQKGATYPTAAPRAVHF